MNDPFPPIEVSAHGLTVAGRLVALQMAPLVAARLLCARPGAVVSVEDLCAAIWGNPDQEPEWPDSALRVTMTRLRKALAPVGLTVINVRKHGYRLEVAAHGRRARIDDLAALLGVPAWTVARLCMDAGCSPSRILRRITPGGAP
jgi:DNA-binding winged helix-turn-helix (wHTH) protein